MPPQQTDPGFEVEGDAAVRGLDLTIGLMKEAADDTRNVLSLLKRYWRAFGEWRQRQRSRTTLHELSDRELMDIGVTRDAIDYIARHRAVDNLRDGTAYFWIQSRGVM
ncbi:MULTISPECIES: DUF1127 domain-containing protein [Bradyrhizobium]|uniref:Uncharacterized conserved protein YjiS, DUF1127 family n=2 Tax=Bradyrhizobium TaxID=374 RepID=A0ABY0QED0_9BRAD|nr:MULTISPECIES: DUF1127 domain-containing protein [Bradyrhizobium]SDK03740.1 Uncharacterized conserved protein YjiS, DUF1127 family [Bradyrhizobium ottawaense]SEB86498.1 Uncharacterized conserved protein YjiS, DUF1127 family [Bradyrhizobium lablabi]